MVCLPNELLFSWGYLMVPLYSSKTLSTLAMDALIKEKQTTKWKLSNQIEIDEVQQKLLTWKELLLLHQKLKSI